MTKRTKINFVVWVCFAIGFSETLLAATPNVDIKGTAERIDRDYLQKGEQLDGLPMDIMRYNDAFLFRSAYASGGDLFQQFVRFLFPISGREKRVMFLPTPYWDTKKPRYHKIQWKRFESDHFDFYAYPESQQTLPSVIKYYEEEYERNNRVFGVDSKFTKKIPVIFYQTRRDFEQTAIVDGPIPEGLGGLTEIFGWRRVTFPFEGEWSKFEHVAKHEGTHVFQIAKKAKKVPLWFIEGSAETNSVYWDSDAEMIIRDAFLNGFFLHIPDLWQIEGTWLMYKIGNFMCNVIWDEYGEEGYRKIMDNASSKSFESNLKDSIGLNLEELDRKVQSTLLQRYSYLLKREDILKDARELASERVILASRGRFYISGGLKGPRNAMFINYIGPDGEVTTEDVVEDKVYNNESLENFDKGAWITDSAIIYSVKRSANDELRIISYTFDQKKKKFNFSLEQVYAFKGIDRIQSPVLLNEQEVAFIGYEDGFSNLYIANLTTNAVEKITKGQSHYIDLDYSPVTNQLVYSLERERAEKKIFYNRDLFLMDVKTRKTKNITTSPKLIDIQPRFSPDGKKIIYVSTPDMTYDLMLYDVEGDYHQRLTTMNIGAKNPQWSTDGSILFNGFKQGAPSIYQYTISDSKKIFQKAKPNYQTENFVFEDGKVVVPTVTKTDKKPDEIIQTGVYVREQKPVIRYQDRSYTGKSISTLDKKIVVKADEGLPGDKRTKHESLPHYFEIQGTQIQSLKSSMVAEDGLSDEIQNWAAVQLAGRDIVQSWMSQDHKKALLVVNNRLAKDYESFKKKPEVSLLVYDGVENHMDELVKAPIKKLDQTIQWVAFLKNDRIFMAMGDQKIGPFDIYIYDQRKKTYELLDREVAQFRISNDFSKVMWRNEGYTLADYSTDKPEDPVYLDDVPDRTMAAEFNSNNDPVFFSNDTSKKKWTLTTYKNKKYTAVDYVRKEDEPVRKVAIANDGTVALVISPKDKKEQESVWIWSPGQGEPMKLNTSEENFSSPIFRKNYLTFYAAYYDSRPSKEYVWNISMGQKVTAFDQIQSMTIQDQQLLYEGQEQLAKYDQKQGMADVIDSNTMGYSIKDNNLYYSAKQGRYFQVSQYDLKSQSKKTITSSDYDKFNPTKNEKNLTYVAQKEGQWSVETQDLSTGKTENISSPNYDFTNIKIKNGEWEVEAQTKKKDYPIGPDHIAQPDYPTMLQPRPAPQTLKLQNLAAALAYDGEGIRYFISGYADNLFSDRGVYVNSMFLEDTKFATIGYSNLNTGNSTSFFYNTRDGIENMGIDLSKNFIFDRYRQLTPYVDFEYQAYSYDSSIINSFIDPSFNNQTYYLAKFGVVYSYDVTVWDRHGPVSGGRLYFRTETGIDMSNGESSNTDGNIDVRVYNRILPRFGLAHRLSGGTSQGAIPNIYLLGGNMSFRGVGFDDLVGQNYWVFSEDIRLPIFDFIGAKFFDPADMIFGLFTRYFDVRAGIYTDIGSTWMNNQDPDFIYSVGYFVNIPTVFGLIVRLNQGFAGRKNFGLWFGTNW